MCEIFNNRPLMCATYFMCVVHHCGEASGRQMECQEERWSSTCSECKVIDVQPVELKLSQQVRFRLGKKRI